MDVVSACSTTTSPITNTNGTLFSFNGVDTMVKYAGTTWAAHTGGTIGLYGAYYDKRLWCVDETYADMLNFSTQTPDATQPLNFVTNGTSSNPGTITFEPGMGKKIRGIKPFKNALYVLCQDAIYRLTPASAANTYTVELITNSIGCISHRSIAQVENDLYFAANDGVYSLGEVANYVSIRTTNKSGRIQEVFDNLSAANKGNLVGSYFNFKYHLFYSLFGTSNDSCVVYDIRYDGWQDWRNIAANSATLYTDSTGETDLFFGEPTTGKVHKMYSGITDDGTLITSTWYSKSFDENIPDITKLYFDHTFVFGALNGTVTVSVIFNDSETSSSKSISQTRPQGGYGRDAYGRMAYGDATNTSTVTQYFGVPLRMRVKGQKFAVQYRITSPGGDWRLDDITTTFLPFNHYKFPSNLKLN